MKGSVYRFQDLSKKWHAGRRRIVRIAPRSPLGVVDDRAPWRTSIGASLSRVGQTTGCRLHISGSMNHARENIETSSHAPTALRSALGIAEARSAARLRRIADAAKPSDHDVRGGVFAHSRFPSGAHRAQGLIARDDSYSALRSGRRTITNCGLLRSAAHAVFWPDWLRLRATTPTSSKESGFEVVVRGCVPRIDTGGSLAAAVEASAPESPIGRRYGVLAKELKRCR